MENNKIKLSLLTIISAMIYGCNGGSNIAQNLTGNPINYDLSTKSLFSENTCLTSKINFT